MDKNRITIRNGSIHHHACISLISIYACCASSSIFAQETSSNDSNYEFIIQDIVVTAQKRSENIQDIPKVVDVVNQTELQRAGVTNIQDLGRVSPSIQGVSGTPFSPPAIRGISSFALSIGVQTQTGVVIDDIPQPSFSTLANELTDIERVEVLPGPQSTLSGRNAAGGLVNIVTHSPTREFTGNYSFEQTGDRQTRAGGYFSGPLSNTLGFSVSAFYNDWEGPVRNVAENGRRLNGFRQRGVRGKLQWAPSSVFTATLTSYYTKADYENTALIAGAPYVAAAEGAGSVFAPGATMEDLHPGATIAPFSRTVSTPGHSTASNENKGIALRLDYDSKVGTISSISSYSRSNQPRNDLFLGFPFYGINVYAHTDTRVKYGTQEIRLASPADAGRFKYLLGAIYTDTRNFQPYSRSPVFPVDWDRQANMRSLAVYGRGTYSFLESTSLTLGLRYQRDKQSYVFDFVDGTAPTSRGSSKYDFLAGEASLQHDFTRNIKGYVTYANAQTGQAYDLEDSGSAATIAGLLPLASEKVQNYEAGLKTQWLDRRLTINLSLFRARYSNYQVQAMVQSNDPDVVPVIRLYAVGKVENKGVELESSFAVSRNFNLGLSGSYLDARILDYPGAQCYTGQTEAQGCVDGTQNRRGVLPGTSKFRMVASANATVPFDTLPFDGTLGAFFRYQSRTMFDLLGDPAATQKRYGILNLTAGIRDKDGHYSAELFVNNAFNKHYYANLSQDGLSPAFAMTASYGRDSFRYWGGRFNLHF